MIEKEFLYWLKERKRLKKKSAGDVISRCKRIERTFEIELDSTLKNQKGYNTLYKKLMDKSDLYLKKGSNKATAVAVLRRAAKHYFEFLQE